MCCCRKIITSRLVWCDVAWHSVELQCLGLPCMKWLCAVIEINLTWMNGVPQGSMLSASVSISHERLRILSHTAGPFKFSHPACDENGQVIGVDVGTVWRSWQGSVSVRTQSDHLMPRMSHSFHLWKVLDILFCYKYRLQDSLLYRRMLKMYVL